MNAVDTNVLFYAHDPRETVKQPIAVSLIQSPTDGVLLWQVACEYLSASRKLEPYGSSRDQAWQDIEDLQRVGRLYCQRGMFLTTRRYCSRDIAFHFGTL